MSWKVMARWKEVGGKAGSGSEVGGDSEEGNGREVEKMYGWEKRRI